jgi:hypothetical protein
VHPPQDFVFGRPNSIPKGVEMAMEGMRQGGRRKILVPPSLGWSTRCVCVCAEGSLGGLLGALNIAHNHHHHHSGGFPEPETFSGKRKLTVHINEPLLMKVELVRVRKRGQAAGKGGPEA